MLVLCFVFYCAQTALAQEKYTISGIVTDAETGEELVGVNVYEKERSGGTTTKTDGFYSLTLSGNTYQIIYSFVGYKTVEKEVHLTENSRLNIELSPSPLTLGETVISSEKEDQNITSTQVSVVKLDIKQVEKIPVIMGETDIFKTIQLLPGITSIAEGRSGFIVRGSGIDQNLILMDGMPIYYSSHMQGLYSVFNSDAVDRLTVYKGGIPAHFGGRGASVLDVRMKESDFDRYHAKMSIGLITSKFSLEAPVINDKLSVFLAGRSTKKGIGNLHDRIKEDNSETSSQDGKGGGKGGRGSGDDFYFFARNESWMDLNGKIIYKINDNNSLYLSGYAGRDSALVAGGLTEWGNRAASLRWVHQFNSKFLSDTSLIRSRYYTEQAGGIYHFTSGIKTSSFRQEFSYVPNDKNRINLGFTSEYQDFNHGALEDETQDDAGKFMPPMQGLESAFYVENDQKLTQRLSTYYGLRYSLYHRLGPGDSFTYDEESNEPLSSEYYPERTDVMAFHHSLEPRFALTCLVDDRSSFKVSYNRNAQYLRLMSLGAEIQWYDIWMPSTENIDPMLTDQFALGYFRNFRDNEFKFSVETYYKRLNGAADFEDGLHNYLVDNLEAYVATGIGRSYGFEIMLEKTKGRFTSRLNYNLGRSDYKIDVINQGRWYSYMFDKTHDLAWVASFGLLKNITLSSTFLYSTGRPVTLPEAYYYISGTPFPFWEGRNKYRLPDYHRLDFGIKYEPEFLKIDFRKYNREITPDFELSFYNVYNRRNVHTIDYSMGGGKGGGIANNDAAHVYEPYGTSTYGFMPSFQIDIQF
jgi:hypothetical protein